MMQMPSGAYCTMPSGHSGDHIAESVRKGNIIDSSREAAYAPVSGRAQTVKVKGGGCAVVAVALLGGAAVAVLGAFEAVRHFA